MARSTKIQAISEQLRMEILSGRFDGTRMLPSEHQLMRRFSVARETIRGALRDLLEKNLVDRRPGYGTFLATRAKVAASRKFGVIMPDAYYPFYARIGRGIEVAAQRHGWTTLSAALGSGDMRDRAVKALDFAEVCIRERVSGAFVQPLQFLKDGERYNRLLLNVFTEAGIPVILLDSDIVPIPRRSEYDLVGVDNLNAGYALAQHVIAAGARNIWYFSNPLPAQTSVNRGNGVGMAVIEAGLRWTHDSIFFADPTDARAARRLFAGRNRPDAIIAVNDYVAATLLKTMTSIGVRVPDDCLLAGVNGDPCAEETSPQITTGVQPCAALGEAAVSVMLQRMNRPQESPRQVLLPISIIARASTQRRQQKAPRKGRKQHSSPQPKGTNRE